MFRRFFKLTLEIQSFKLICQYYDISCVIANFLLDTKINFILISYNNDVLIILKNISYNFLLWHDDCI
jgi:hypothetical protein